MQGREVYIGFGRSYSQKARQLSEGGRYRSLYRPQGEPQIPKLRCSLHPEDILGQVTLAQCSRNPARLDDGHDWRSEGFWKTIQLSSDSPDLIPEAHIATAHGLQVEPWPQWKKQVAQSQVELEVLAAASSGLQNLSGLPLKAGKKIKTFKLSISKSVEQRGLQHIHYISINQVRPDPPPEHSLHSALLFAWV